MPTESYSTVLGGPRRVEASWTGDYNDLTLKFDGEVVGHIATGKELRQTGPLEFKLPDSTKLTVQLSGLIFPQLQIGRGTLLLPEFEAIARIRQAGWVMFILTGLCLVMGIAPFIIEPGPWITETLSFPLVCLMIAVPFGVLTYMIMRRSLIAVIIAAVIGVLLVLGTVVAIIVGGVFTSGFIVLAFLVFQLLRAVNPALSLHQGKPVNLLPF
jgi:hypothetical protein